jgi:hypothetical protein
MSAMIVDNEAGRQEGRRPVLSRANSSQATPVGCFDEGSCVSFPAFIDLARGDSSVAATVAAIDWGGQSGFAYVFLVLCLWLLGCDFIGSCALVLLVVNVVSRACVLFLARLLSGLYQICESQSIETLDSSSSTIFRYSVLKSFHVAERSCYLVQ